MAIAKKPPVKNTNLLSVQSTSGVRTQSNVSTPNKDKRGNLLPSGGSKREFLTPDRSGRTLDSNNSTPNKQRVFSHSPARHDWGNTEILPKPSKLQVEKPKPVSSAVYSVDGQHLEGVWQQYEGIWFDIHSQGMGPMFQDFPTPKAKTTDNIPDRLPKNMPTSTRARNPVTAQWKKPKFLGGDDDDDLILCLKCKKKKKKGVYLGCMHFFCKECLYTHFKKHLDEKKIPVKCMATNCKYDIQRNELVKIAHNSEEIKAFYDMNVTRFVEKRPHQLVQCYTPGCGYVCDLSKSKDKNTLPCPRCNKSFCIRCHQTAHPGVACEEAKENA